MVEDMLVSIITPTYNRTKLLIERALPSVFAQTHTNWEWIVVGDGTEQATIDIMANIDDPRVRFFNLPRTYYSFPTNTREFWMIQAVDIVNFGLDICKGQWITKLDDDDELVPEHIELLLNAAIEQNVDYIYGRTMVYDTNNNYYGILGHWPPEVGGMGVGLWKSSLKYRYNPKSWEKDLPADWELITQLLSDNIKIGYLHKATYKYYPILAIPKCEVE